jgi:superfamily II DNA or RNA helicase
MPTGAGKTRIAAEIISHFLNTGINKGEQRQVLWISEKEELCEQAINGFTSVWSHIGKLSVNVYRLFGTSLISGFSSNSFIVASYGKLRSIIRNSGELPKPDLIVCDEAHNVIAPTYSDSIEKLRGNGTRIIGLTATPIRGIKTTENEDLMDFFDRKIIDIDSDENSIEYLQRRGYLAHCLPETIDTQITFRISKDVMRLMSLERDLPPNFLHEVAIDNKRNLIIARLLKKLADERIKVLYFAPSVYQSKLMCALLLSLGHSAAHIDGKSPTSYRRDTVLKFRQGLLKILCNFDVFTTGFDDPKIDAIVIARPTTSIVLHQQMIGRGMRGPLMGGSSTFRLYRIKDNFPDIEIADQYFSDFWKE